MEKSGNGTQRWSVAKQGLAALAAGAGLGAAMEADAAIIYTDVTPDAFIQNSSRPIDLDSNGAVDFTLSHTEDTTTGAFSVILSGPGSSQVIGDPVEIPFAAKPFALSAGSPIGPGAQFTGLPGTMSGDSTIKPFWENGTNAYLGLKFDIGGETHFGWAHVQTDIPATAPPGAQSSATLFGYAYCDQANEGLRAGQTQGGCFVAVPVPPSLALLAAGAVTALALRRRKPADR